LNAGKTPVIRELENKYGITFKSGAREKADQSDYTIEGRKLSKTEREEMNKFLKDNQTSIGREMYYSSSETYPRIMSLRHAADMTPQTEITDEYLDSLDTKEGSPAQKEYRELKDIYGKDEVKKMLKDFVSTETQTPRKDTYASLDNKNNKQDMYKKNKYALGGILQGAQIGGQALQILDQLLTEQAAPMPMDRNSFNKGGDLNLSSSAVKIQGTPGVDTNRRVVNGKPFYFTKEEVIDNDFVYSDDVKDTDGKTFAKKAEKVAKSSGKVEKRLKLNTSDLIAKATLRRNQQRMDQLAQKQEEVKASRPKNRPKAPQIPTRYNDGGLLDDVLKGAYGNFGATTTDAAFQYMSDSMQPGGNFDLMTTQLNDRDRMTRPLNTLPGPEPQPLPERLETMLQMNKRKNAPLLKSLPSLDSVARQRGYSKDVREMSNNLPKPSKLKEEGLDLTLGDKGYLAGKGIELLSKGIMAAQPAQKISSRPFEVDPQRMSATPALQANTRNYRSAVQNIDTGNASIDRVSKANLFGAKTQADTQALTQTQNANRQAQLQTDQYNSQVRQRVEQANTQALGAKQNMMDNLFTSIGEAGRIAQDGFNTKLTNNIRLEALNGLSQYFQVSPDYLRSIMKSNPVQYDKMMIEYNQNANKKK